MKFIHIILIFLNILSIFTSLFENSKYIKELPNVAALDFYLNNSNITIGMMLVYSVYCGHCHNFAKTYQQLAEKYNNQLLFFAMNVNSDYYKRMPSTWGVPYILFFSDGYFYQFKRRRSFEEISYTIDNFYLTRCREITYKNIENVYYNVFLKKEKNYNNLIIGYFDENSNNDIDKFKNSTKWMCPECVGLCYICKDFKENKNENNTFLKNINNNIIVGYLPNNSSKVFLWKNKDNKYDELINNYEEFINKDLKREYFNINNKEKLYMIDFFGNKNCLFFVYKINDEKIIYENNINELINASEKNILSLYNLVLYNLSDIQSDKLDFINSNGIYEISQDLNLTYKFNNFEEFKNLFNNSNISNHKFEIDNKPLIPEVKKDDKNLNDNPNPNELFNEEYFFKILEKICVVLFTIVITLANFFLMYNKYYSKIDKDKINSKK